MVKVQQRRYKLKKKIDALIFNQIISYIRENSRFVPVLLNAQETIFKTLRLEGKALSSRLQPSRYQDEEFLGELFQPSPKIVIYIKAPLRREFIRRGYRVVLTRGLPSEKATESVEVGELNSGSKDQVFGEFILVFEKAVGKILKAETIWEDINLLDKIKETVEISEDLTPNNTNVIASKKIADANVRNFLQIIKTGLLTSDIQEKTQLNNEKIEKLNSELEKLKLTSKHYVIVCSKTRDFLVKTGAKSELGNLIKQKISCGKCGRPFSEELSEEVVGITDFGIKLIDGSRWFTILVLDLLLSMGIPKSHIRVGVTDITGETDILFCIGQNLTLVELKDRDFNLNDGFKLNARIDSFEANAAVVISSRKVIEDAKKFLQDLSRKYKTPVLFIEGLENLEEKIKKKIIDDNRELIEEIMLGFSPKIGVPAARLIIQRFCE